MANRTLSNLEGMYGFSYKPIGLGQLSVYDKKPLIFILDMSGGQLLGCNLHWIAKIHRQSFIDSVTDIMGKTIIKANKKRERIRLIYTLLKQPKFRNGLQAVRRYFISGMTSIEEIPKDKWNNILGISKFQSDKRLKSNEYKKVDK